LADVQRVEHLHIRKAVEKDDALDQLVGGLPLLDRFLTPLLCEIFVAPVVEQPIVQPILVDRRQLMPKCLIEELNDLCVALHNSAPVTAAQLESVSPRR